MSLSELTEYVERHGVRHLEEDAVVLLIEIAQAALAWKRAADDDDTGLVEFDRACETLSATLAKVQP